MVVPCPIIISIGGGLQMIGDPRMNEESQGLFVEVAPNVPLWFVFDRGGVSMGGVFTAITPQEPVIPVAAVRGAAVNEARDTTQSHFVLGTDTFGARDPRRYALAILTNVLGGGMSSRLFQRIREELGLAYAVYAFQQGYQSTGMVGVYVGTHPATAEAAEAAIRAELTRLAVEGLDPAELATGRQQLKGQVMLSLESPGSRMHRLAGTVLHRDRYRKLDEILAEIDAVNGADIRALAMEYFQPDRWSVVRLGPSDSR